MVWSHEQHVQPFIDRVEAARGYKPSEPSADVHPATAGFVGVPLGALLVVTGLPVFGTIVAAGAAVILGFGVRKIIKDERQSKN